MATAAAGLSWKPIGLYLRLAGGAAFVVGGILSLHHYAIGICFVAGAAAYYVGGKLKAA